MYTHVGLSSSSGGVCAVHRSWSTLGYLDLRSATFGYVRLLRVDTVGRGTPRYTNVDQRSYTGATRVDIRRHGSVYGGSERSDSTGLSHEGNTIYSNDWVGELNTGPMEGLKERCLKTLTSHGKWQPESIHPVDNNRDSQLLQELAREAKEGLWDTLPICAIAEAHKRKAEQLMACGNPDYNGSSDNSEEVYVEFLKYLWLYPRKNDPEYHWQDRNIQNGAFAGASDRWSSFIRRFTQASWRTSSTTLQVGDTGLYLWLASAGEQIKAHILVCKKLLEDMAHKLCKNY
ncbi:hypothetical protein B0H11DRAFT_2383316 [Mycena galericulata]|nr:hypothetical protein B0H11DRAFT_2383316 [Mycena galericulata]